MIYLKIRKRPVIHITKKAITCDDQTIITDHVTRIWNGSPAGGPMGLTLDIYFGLMMILGIFFANLKAIVLFALLYACTWAVRLALRFFTRGLQVELDTGSAYCFTSNDGAFVKTVRERILDYLASEDGEEGITVDFKNRQVVTGALPPPQQAAAVTAVSSAANEAILSDLRQFMQHCKSVGREDTYALLDEIKKCVLANQQDELKRLHVRFVQAGLIQDCNELGLHTLLNEIKSSIYRESSVSVARQ